MGAQSEVATNVPTTMQQEAQISAPSAATGLEVEHKLRAGGAAITSGSTSSIKVPDTIAKTSQDTKVQRSQELSHLQLVLGEVDKLTKNLTANERLDWGLQLPYIALGYFNKEGGSLSLDEDDVHLTIPSNAIAQGSPQQVYIYVDPRVTVSRKSAKTVDPTAPQGDAAEPTEVALSASVECGPEGMEFKESVVLSIPHHADVESANSKTLRPRMCQEDDSSERWEEFEGNALITEDRMILLVNHFSWFKLFGPSRKRLLVVPYGDDFDPSQKKYQIRVYVLNNDKMARKNVESCEQSLVLDGFKKVNWSGSDLSVKLLELPQRCNKVFEGDTQTIKGKRIRQHDSNFVTLTLGIPTWHEDDVLFCVVETYKANDDEETREKNKVQHSISPNIKKPDRGAAQRPVYDQATACSQTAPQADGTSMTLEDEVKSGVFKRKPSQSAMGDSCDLVGNPSSYPHSQVKQLLDAGNDSGDGSRQYITVPGNTWVYIGKTDGENKSTLNRKFSQDICRVKTEEEKRSRKKVVDDSTLRTLACELGSEWERLATFLGFGVNDVYKFKNDNPHVTNNQIFQMLVKWRDERYLKEQVDHLGHELIQVNRGDIAQKMRDIDDSSLRVVSNKLGPDDWKSLATSLELDNNNVPCDTRQRSFQMLVEWRDKQLSPKVQVDKLCKELKRVEREELADKMQKLVIC